MANNVTGMAATSGGSSGTDVDGILAQLAQVCESPITSPQLRQAEERLLLAQTELTDPDSDTLDLAVDRVYGDMEALDEQLKQLRKDLDDYLAQLQEFFLAVKQALARAEGLGGSMAAQVEDLTSSYYSLDNV